MERLQVTTLTDQDLSSAALVATFEATADAELLINLYLSGLAGSGVYRACLTKQLGGEGEAYQSATTIITLSGSVTTAYLPTTPMAVQAGDVVQVYAQGLEADVAVGVAVEVFDVTAVSEGITAQDVWDALVAAQDTDGSLGKLVADYLDAAISSRATPAQLSVAISATQAAALATGSLAIVTDYALSQSISSTTTVDLEEAGSKLYLAIKEKETNADAAALALIEKTAGLVYLAQEAAADAALGSLTVSGSTGAWSILIWLDETATGELRSWKGNRYYELKHVPAAGDPTLISTGRVVISIGIVRAVS